MYRNGNNTQQILFVCILAFVASTLGLIWTQDTARRLWIGICIWIKNNLWICRNFRKSPGHHPRLKSVRSSNVITTKTDFFINFHSAWCVCAHCTVQVNPNLYTKSILNCISIIRSDESCVTSEAKFTKCFFLLFSKHDLPSRFSGN